MEKEVGRLQRIDWRLNKDLVVKPYNYIDKMKEHIDKEWEEAKTKMKEFNEKFMSRLVTVETNTNQVLTDGKFLAENLKKMIAKIQKDLVSIKNFKDKVDSEVTNTQF